MFLNALEESGKDWNAISTLTEMSIEVCQSSFLELEKEVKKMKPRIKERFWEQVCS